MHSFLLATLVLVSCQNKDSRQDHIKLIDKTQFETTIDNKPVDLYTLSNKSGMTMQVTNFGARVVNLWVADRNGNFSDVVLGYDSISKYIDNKGERFLGATIGRYGNRIANGRFVLDSKEYNLPINNNGQSLHGGDKGFDMVVWNVDSVTNNKLYFSYLSKDGEQGYPGNLNVHMNYELTDSNEFIITYSAKTDAATPINLTHHSFFNLRGEGNGTVNDHILTINADMFTPIDSVLIPLGDNISVESSPFDFRTPHTIGDRVNSESQQLTYGGGYDHNFVLNRNSESDIEFAASILEPESGRYMEVWTTEPGLQFYGGNFFDGKTKAKASGSYDYRGSFALETQHFPDSPNNPKFPSTILTPNETYTHTCIYKFSTK
ncbi:MAG: aldose epimerase family protein [Bacteroidales bacterium]